MGYWYLSSMSAPPTNYLDGMALGLNSTGLLNVNNVNSSSLAWLPFVVVSPNGPVDGGNFGPNTVVNGVKTTTGGIQEAINASNYVWLSGNVTPKTFQKVVIQKQNCGIVIPPGSSLVLPAGYADYVFELNDLLVSMVNVSITGDGVIYEGGANPSNNWSFLRLYSHSSNGIFYCKFMDTWLGHDAAAFSKVNVGIQMDIDSPDGFINSNIYQNHKFFDPVTAAFKWNPTSTSHNFNQNTYIHEQVEMAGGGSSLVSFDNADGQGNVYLSVSPDDSSGSQKTATVASTAAQPLVLGGVMTDMWTNNSMSAQVIDPYQGALFPQVTIVPGSATPLVVSGTSGSIRLLEVGGNSVIAVDTPTGNFGLYQHFYYLDGMSSNLTDNQVMRFGTKSGVPSDGDFNSPVTGLGMVDLTNNKVDFRMGTGSWRGAALAGFSIPRYGSRVPILNRPGPYKGIEDNFDETSCPICRKRMKPEEPIVMMGDRYYSDGGLHAYASHLLCGFKTLLSDDKKFKRELRGLLSD